MRWSLLIMAIPLILHPVKADGSLRNIRLFHVYTIFLISFGLAGISVGSGAMWPNFKETVPSKIVSGIGGTLNLIVSVFFVILMIFVVAIPGHFYIMKLKGALFPSRTVMAVILSIAAFISLGSGLLFLAAGTRNFKKMEVA